MKPSITQVPVPVTTIFEFEPLKNGSHRGFRFFVSGLDLLRMKIFSFATMCLQLVPFF